MGENDKMSKTRLREIAGAHRKVNFAVLFYLIQAPLFAALFISTENTKWSFIPFIYLFCFAGYASFCVYHLIKYFNKKTTAIAVVVVAFFVPLIGLIVLVTSSQKATNLLKRNGIEVGLLGAKPESI